LKVKLGLWVEVPELEAHFNFFPDAEHEIALAQWYKAHSVADGKGGKKLDVDTDNLPPDFAALVEAMFVKAVHGWQGVDDDDTGLPLKCDAESRAAVETSAKCLAIFAYFNRLGGVQAKEPSGDGPPTPPSASGGELPATASSPSPLT
jgi:hypothetical protein